MEVGEITSRYQWTLSGALVALLIVALVLTATHALALRGRTVLPEGVQRRAGWLVLGLLVGVVTVISAEPGIVTLVGAGLLALWIARWAWREGRLDDMGVALIGGSLPWIAAYIFFLAAFPADPVVHEQPDRRLFVLVGALLVGALGLALVVAPPAARPRRVRTALDRARLLVSTIERGQAMGPVPAPLTIGFVAGLVASTLSLVLARDLAPLPRSALSAAAFVLFGLAVWFATVPPRVGRAYDVVSWLQGLERRTWHERLGHPLPQTLGGARRLLDSLPNIPMVRPLRIELLASFGRTDDARAELQRLEPVDDAGEAEAAELAAHIAWCDGTTDATAIRRLEAAVARLDDPDLRLRFRAALALALARRDALAGSPTAIDHLAAVQPDLGARGSAFALPYAWAIVALFVMAGVLSIVLSGALEGLLAAR